MNKRRGRPALRPTPAQRRTVERLCAVGETNLAIARVLNVSHDTLTRRFADELANGRSRRRAEMIRLLWANARRGNFSSQRKLLEMMDAAPTPKSRPPRTYPVGKKELAEAEAAADGTSWSDLVH